MYHLNILELNVNLSIYLYIYIYIDIVGEVEKNSN